MNADLARLAEAYGVAVRYEDSRRRQVRVSPDTLVAVLAALGVDASTHRSVRAGLERATSQRRALPPTVVVRSGGPMVVEVRAGAGAEVWVETDGGERRMPRRAATEEGSTATDLPPAAYELPHDVPLGYHRVHVRDGERRETALLVVTPDRLDLASVLGDRRVWGFMLQLYSVRSRDSWGLGDLHDLASVVRWSAAELGAGMVVVNPLHAAEPAPPMEPSPYLPSSRRFGNPIYLRVEDIPEYAALPARDLARVERLAAPVRARNRTPDLLDRDGCWAAKLAALELVHRVPLDRERRDRYAAFRAREGRALADFATWCALAEEHGPDFGRWPAELRDPRSDAAVAAGARLAERVNFHCWLQWLLDEQMAGVQRAARDAGMPLGVVHDLAVGVGRGGADAWLYRGVLAHGVTVGAPPDAFNQQGQDWQQPPWHPNALAEAGYAPYRDLLRHALRHTGGLRVDHILGLFRLWWVPDGAPPSAGTYVRYDHEAMVGILALEAHLAGAVVVGEDLGTVEPWVRGYLDARGLLGTSMLWFERERGGSPRPPQRWRERCLATVVTHDLPPVAAFLAGEQVALRARLGLLTRPVEDERADADRQLRAWTALLADLGLVGPDPDVPEMTEALHAFLARTPARLVGVSLADAVGERRTQNQPGTVDEYPNWRVPLADAADRPVLVEDLAEVERVRRVARAVTDRLGPEPLR